MRIFRWGTSVGRLDRPHRPGVIEGLLDHAFKVDYASVKADADTAGWALNR